MTTVIPHSELVKRAAAWVAEHRAEQPSRPVTDIVDEAGARFNLGPMETEMLLDLFRNCHNDHIQE
ncbi:hypothetical protein [Nitratidesulfovibrio liaohensis]|uniref:Uncharacterized protein n=1 Tax=Nitratidesulfovibrio liaohensis TaxID=2604158 RepID=A0ABY9R2G9_9BACT|nr:hypothetical protein [Nitratidesulfovibrio liaohensis]WMW65948.1 hypothetical protein KPS_000481 [Nitratidesulfovibrio liaohensis]